MKKNVYTKSVLRQPVYSLILGFLLLVATFGFVLRSIEFFTVREQIYAISDYFESIGFIRGITAFDDVNAGADFLEHSPYIGIADRRRVVEGVLQDVLNSATADPWGVHSSRNAEILGVEIQEGPKDVFFYGELTNKVESRQGQRWILTLNVDDVVIGYPEYVVAGQSDLQILFNVEDGNEFVMDSLEIGGRYLFRVLLTDTPSGRMPSVGDPGNTFHMQPLYPDGLWYLHVPAGETVDLMNPELTMLAEEIETLQHYHHIVQLQTTRDMALVPIMLEDDMGFMVEGRPIDYEDYSNANPVAVVHRQFARIRNLNIGDTITVEIPQVHEAENMNTDVFTVMALSGISVGERQSLVDIHVEGTPQAEGVHELELEIVGIYSLFEGSGGDPFTNFSTRIYIPDSVLPDDMIITSERWESPTDQNYLPSFWYTFRLNNSRDELPFLMENHQPLAEMGLMLIMVVDGSDSVQNFWQSANIILQTTTFNAIVFCVVLILVLILVVFLFLRQRRKELTINRMLGYSTIRSVKDILKTSILFFMPIIIGAVLAWLFANHTIMNTMVIFEDLTGYEAVFTLSPLWLGGLIMLVFMLILLMVLIGIVRLSYRPLLELLQRRG